MEKLRVIWGEATGRSVGEADGRVRALIERNVSEPGGCLPPVLLFGGRVVGGVFTLTLIPLTAYYIAVRPQPLIPGAPRLISVERRGQARAVMERIRDSWIGWMKGVLVDMAVSGVLVYVGLRLVGVEFALVFAAQSAVLVIFLTSAR